MPTTTKTTTFQGMAAGNYQERRQWTLLNTTEALCLGDLLPEVAAVETQQKDPFDPTNTYEEYLGPRGTFTITVAFTPEGEKETLPAPPAAAPRAAVRQVPSVGRIVHYYERRGLPGSLFSAGPPLAAIIGHVGQTHLGEDVCVLSVVGLDGVMFPVGAVPYSEQPKGGHWSWPPFVPPTKE